MSLGAVSASNLLTSLWINVVTSVVFLIFYAIAKNLPFLFRIYYTLRYLKGQVEHVDDLEGSGDLKQYEVAWRSYRHILVWIKSIWGKLNLTENSEFIERYGLDSAVLLRTFLLGLKVFLPLTLWGCVVLIPVNKADNELASFQSDQSNVIYTKVDNWSIANVHDLSERKFYVNCSLGSFILAVYHRNIILALIIKHITLMGLSSIKRAFSGLFLLPLLALTIIFHVYRGQRFWPAFRNLPLEEAKCKDKMNGSIDIEDMLKEAYLHPAIQLASVDADCEYPDTIRDGTAPPGAFWTILGS